MKKFKKVVAAAIAMMTLSTAAAVTGTVAWFTASNVVTANGMNLQADTEQGINISNEAKAEWKDSAVASHKGLKSDGTTPERFIPTTTTNTATWLHGNSADRNNSDADGDLVALPLSAVNDGIAKVDLAGSKINGKCVYLVNSFYLRSSSPEPIHAEKLYVNSVVGSGSTSSVELDRSFRVLIKQDTNIAIFAPFEDAVDTKAPAIIAGTKNTVLHNGNAENTITIPAASDDSSAAALEIKVYCYFDGNDSNCMSKNIPEDGIFSTLSVECKFGTETIA